MASISIIIRCKNEDCRLDKTLEKIFSQKTGCAFEVIAVDSGSTDRTLPILQKHKIRTLQIRPEEFSYGRALNYGIAHAQGDIICNLSVHCLPADHNWLEKLILPILAGTAHASFGRQIPSAGGNLLEEIHLAKLFPPAGPIPPPLPFSNAHCAFLRQMWETLKFDEELPRLEDRLWYLLLKDRYHFAYCPEAVVTHSHPLSRKAIETISFRDGRAKKMIFEKYGLDLLETAGTTFSSKAGYVLKDFKETLIELRNRKSALPEAAKLLSLKTLGYLSFRKGYRSPG
ncbi:MAG TPA: glycosyltransferase family 2 protein [Candidatus Omnitrophota bacterium]|nr:glycosyltransferase family 2 protein [Candidatus Omnitrophota bacterium]